MIFVYFGSMNLAQTKGDFYCVIYLASKCVDQKDVFFIALSSSALVLHNSVTNVIQLDLFQKFVHLNVDRLATWHISDSLANELPVMWDVHTNLSTCWDEWISCCYCYCCSGLLETLFAIGVTWFNLSPLATCVSCDCEKATERYKRRDAIIWCILRRRKIANAQCQPVWILLHIDWQHDMPCI